jgi:hypothetical protein
VGWIFTEKEGEMRSGEAMWLIGSGKTACEKTSWDFIVVWQKKDLKIIYDVALLLVLQKSVVWGSYLVIEDISVKEAQYYTWSILIINLNLTYLPLLA